MPKARRSSSRSPPRRSSTNEGEVTHIIESCRDITERKRAEDALAQDRNLLRTLIDNLPDCIYVKDTQSRFLAANLATAQLMGATDPNDLLGKTDADFYPPEQAAVSRRRRETLSLRTARGQQERIPPRCGRRLETRRDDENTPARQPGKGLRPRRNQPRPHRTRTSKGGYPRRLRSFRLLAQIALDSTRSLASRRRTTIPVRRRRRLLLGGRSGQSHGLVARSQTIAQIRSSRPSPGSSRR